MPNGLDMTVQIKIDAGATVAELRRRVGTAFRDGIDGVVRDAKKLSPYETGTNRRSIESEFKQTASGFQAEIFTTSGYGGFLEIGSGQRRSQFEQKRNLRGTGGPTPYVRPAFDLNKMGILEALRNCLR